MGVFLAQRPGRDRDKAADLCAPIRTHLVSAHDTALKIADRGERAALTEDVRQLSNDLDQVAQALSMVPKLEWHSSFASLFDSEHDLRTALGLGKIDRPYSGTVDPKVAVEAITKAATDTKVIDSRLDGPAPVQAVPQAVDVPSAVMHVGVALGGMHAQRQLAGRHLSRNLEEKPLPPRKSISDTIVELAVSAAFAAVTGGIGGLVADRFKKVLEKAHGKSIEQAMAGELEGMAADLRKKAIEDRLKTAGALTRVIAADAAKDASKQLFKDLVNQQAPRGGSDAGDIKEFFFQRHETELVGRNAIVSRQAANLAGALSQLELPVLRALVDELTALQPVVYDLEYDLTLREWEKFGTPPGLVG